MSLTPHPTSSVDLWEQREGIRVGVKVNFWIVAFEDPQKMPLIQKPSYVSRAEQCLWPPPLSMGVNIWYRNCYQIALWKDIIFIFRDQILPSCENKSEKGVKCCKNCGWCPFIRKWWHGRSSELSWDHLWDAQCLEFSLGLILIYTKASLHHWQCERTVLCPIGPFILLEHCKAALV